jgi:hypothetical protein
MGFLRFSGTTRVLLYPVLPDTDFSSGGSDGLSWERSSHQQGHVVDRGDSGQGGGTRC